MAVPLTQAAADGAAFVVALRDPERTLRIAGRPAQPRSLSELELQGTRPRPAETTPGLTVVRVDRNLRTVGEARFVEDPVGSVRGSEETFPPGVPVGVAVDEGVFIAEHINGDLYGVMVARDGTVSAPTRLAEAPRDESRAGFVWITLVPRTVDNHRGAAILAGTDNGEVMAVQIGPNGRATSPALHWSQRVGGRMTLIEVPNGVEPAAVLERPVRGTTLRGDQAREQVLVRLRPTLEPAGDPERIGLGPYITGIALREQTVVMTQWAESRGLAVATLPIRDNRITLETPHLWSTTPLDGITLGHTMTLGPSNILYDLILHGDTTAGGLHGYLTYLPPAGTPFNRREVIPLRARVIAPPQLLPADDGVVAVMATYDELGGGVDAVHLRCDMITLPER